MKKKATLIIVNLEKIYTMQTSHGQDVVLAHAYIAMHHDVILEIGEGNYQHLLDKDTRILEGRNHFAIPAFLEVDACYPVCEKRNRMREQQEFRMNLMQHGVLTMATDVSPATYVEMDVVTKHACKKIPILYAQTIVNMQGKWKKKRFCISTRDAHYAFNDPLMLAQLLHMKQGIEPYCLLKALTLYPAKVLNLTNVGVLKKGKQADILVFYGAELSYLFSGLGNQCITQIVKKGVRIYPNLLI